MAEKCQCCGVELLSPMTLALRTNLYEMALYSLTLCKECVAPVTDALEERFGSPLSREWRTFGYRTVTQYRSDSFLNVESLDQLLIHTPIQVTADQRFNWSVQLHEGNLQLVGAPKEQFSITVQTDELLASINLRREITYI